MGKFTFDNVTTSGSGQVVIGENNGGMHQGTPAIQPMEVIDKLVESVPKESQAELEMRVFGPLRSELNTLAAMPVAQAEEQKPTILSRMRGFVSGLASSPHLASIQKATLPFAGAALACIPPPTNWFISGTVAAVNALMKDNSPPPPPSPSNQSGMGDGFNSGFSNNPSPTSGFSGMQ